MCSSDLHFFFYGFLDRSKKKKRAQLTSLSTRKETIIFYESPHRLKETLSELLESFGNREMTVMREMTKVYEQVFRGKIEEIKDYFQANDPRGEFCLLVEGTKEDRSETMFWEAWDIEKHLAFYIDENKMDTKEAIRLVAKERGVQKREVYQIHHMKK